MITKNLFFLFALTIFGIASTLLTIYNYNPYTADLKTFISFYASTAVSFLGIITFAIFYIKIKMKTTESVKPHFWPSVRQGSLGSAAITTGLVLQGLHILDWLIGISIIIVSVLLELFFQTKRKHAE